VKAGSENGCSVNLKANGIIATNLGNEALYWMISICMSHCTCNAADKTGFVILDRFWKLLQSAFSQSDNANALWKNTMDKTWEEYSDTRCFSKYDVIKIVASYFPDMKTVLTQMLEGKASKQSTTSLLKMLTDEST
jgi:hypothetical protein